MTCLWGASSIEGGRKSKLASWWERVSPIGGGKRLIVNATERLVVGPLIGSTCPTIGIPLMPLYTYNNNKYIIISILPFMFIISLTTHDKVKRKYMLMLMLMHHDYP